jgi:hypothetical protein
MDHGNAPKLSAEIKLSVVTEKGSQFSFRETEWCIVYLNNSAAILMGTKINYF